MKSMVFVRKQRDIICRAKSSIWKIRGRSQVGVNFLGAVVSSVRKKTGLRTRWLISKLDQPATILLDKLQQVELLALHLYSYIPCKTIVETIKKVTWSSQYSPMAHGLCNVVIKSGLGTKVGFQLQLFIEYSQSSYLTSQSFGFLIVKQETWAS